jgi:hypothetical protein
LRRLSVIPILHAAADLGSLAPRIQSGRASQSTYQIDEIWTQVRELVLELDFDYARLRLYQDSLPICGFEHSIVSDLASQGSANFRLLAELMSRGAELVGTESPQLLLRELEWVRNPQLATEERLRELTAERDRFIAHRIDSTLAEGEEGLVFLGMLHDLAPYLPETIALRYPLKVEAS